MTENKTVNETITPKINPQEEIKKADTTKIKDVIWLKKTKSGKGLLLSIFYPHNQEWKTYVTNIIYVKDFLIDDTKPLCKFELIREEEKK